VAAEEALLANLDATEQLQYAVIGQAKASIDAANVETASREASGVHHALTPWATDRPCP
jgi:hypothetical protein